MQEKILIVDDEKDIADLVAVYLQNDGYEVELACDAQSALECVEREAFGLAILDVMLPDMDGFALCRRIREKYLFPIIMLTARVEDLDKITGLTVGADDYVTKPFNPLELLARVRTQLRRYTRYNTGKEDSARPNEISIRGLQISREMHKCLLNGKPLTLTPIEFDILWYLCQRQGCVVAS